MILDVEKEEKKKTTNVRRKRTNKQQNRETQVVDALKKTQKEFKLRG